VVLTASGGWNYRWSLSDDAYGTLNATYGESVTYTVHEVPEDVQVTITVTGRVSNYGTNGLYTAEARINHRAPSAD
jgi:VCBS repeat-containing protein